MISIIMKVSLAVFMLAGGMIKVSRVPFQFQFEHWRHYQYSFWFLTVTGILEVVGALAMTAWNRYAALGAGVLFAVLMAEAISCAYFSSATIGPYDDTCDDLFGCVYHDNHGVTNLYAGDLLLLSNNRKSQVLTE